MFSTLKKLLSPIKELKKRYFFYILTSAWFGVMWPLTALIVSRVIKAIEIKNFATFKIYIIAFLALTIFYYATNYFIRTARKITPRLFRQNINQTYIGKYLKADNNTIETLWTWQANSILQKWCDNRKMIVNDIILRPIVRSFVGILMMFIIVITQFWRWMFFIVVLVFIIMIFFARRGNQLMKKIRKERRDVFIQTDRFIVKMIMSKFEILQNNKVIKELKKLRKFSIDIIRRDRKESKWFIIASDIPRALLDFLKVGLVFWYGLQIFKGTAWFGEFTLMWMLLNQMAGILFEINEIMGNYYGQIVFVEKLRDIFDNIAPLKWYETWAKFALTTWKIEVKNISFSYGNKNIFENLSLTIPWKKKTAFVGESWSWKTTLLKLLAGYVHPDGGSICVDNKPLSKVALQTYYKHIWYLTQDPSVFDATVHENLVYALDYEPTKEELDTAIRLAKCDFIYDFKAGLQTEIGERGVRLSWGQKQRLAIAKIMLKNPNIILLDEPTSALDSFNEEQISIALHNLFKWRTVVVVAHRLQTVKAADIIHYMDHGKIIESGTHSELSAAGGRYAKMLDLQTGF